MAFTFKSIISCERLDLHKSFLTICFGDVFSKTCQYITFNSWGSNYISIKSTHDNLQKCIIWPKKSMKGRKK
jgi:hypothetical protein